MKAYHFLQADMRSGEGDEPPWVVGEERTIVDKIMLCVCGYHSSPSWYDALRYAGGPVGCIVEVSEPEGRDGDKQVSRTRKLIAAANVERELRVWACDCAERALLRERSAGREPDPRSWTAIEVARQYAAQVATDGDLAAAWAAAAWAAGAAAGAATWAAAGAVAWDAARAAREAATWDAGDSEIKWQRRRLDELVNRRFDAETELL